MFPTTFAPDAETITLSMSWVNDMLATDEPAGTVVIVLTVWVARIIFLILPTVDSITKANVASDEITTHLGKENKAADPIPSVPPAVPVYPAVLPATNEETGTLPLRVNFRILFPPNSATRAKSPAGDISIPPGP